MKYKKARILALEAELEKRTAKLEKTTTELQEAKKLLSETAKAIEVYFDEVQIKPRIGGYAHFYHPGNMAKIQDLTPGKMYEIQMVFSTVQNSKTFTHTFSILDDKGVKILCGVHNCSYINGAKWHFKN